MARPLQLQYWLDKDYSEEEAKLKVEQIKDKTYPMRINYWINKGYTEEEAKLKISEIQSNRGKIQPEIKTLKKNQLEYWINKGYTEEEAKLKKKEITDKSNRFSVLFWINRGHTEEEAKLKISEIQSSNSKKVKTRKNGANLELLINKGYTQEEAKLKISNMQSTFSLEKCINKYGKELGLVKFKERQIKWQLTLQNKENINEINKSKAFNEEKYILKYGKEKLKELLKKRSNSTFNKYSKISMELFDAIQSNIEEKCFYGKKEKCLKYIDTNLKTKYYYVDFLINNVIIEFYGNYWHANPKLYNEDFLISNGVNNYLAKDKWENDNIRINNIKQLGYYTIIIWENDYMLNKLETINYCLNEIKNNIKQNG